SGPPSQGGWGPPAPRGGGYPAEGPAEPARRGSRGQRIRGSQRAARALRQGGRWRHRDRAAHRLQARAAELRRLAPEDDAGCAERGAARPRGGGRRRPRGGLLLARAALPSSRERALTQALNFGGPRGPPSFRVYVIVRSPNSSFG
ncbi:unnamed protein product, partial [Prorocentrum cordatum]